MRTALILLLCLFLLTGCNSSPKPQIIDNPDPEPSQETITREAVFVYGETKAPEKIILILGAEGIRVEDLGIIRLQGIVADFPKEALIEISGRGQNVSIGSQVGGYKVMSIKEDRVCLRK